MNILNTIENYLEMNLASMDVLVRSLLSISAFGKGKEGSGRKRGSLSSLMTPLGREDWYKCYSRERFIRVMEVVRWVLSYTFYMLFPGNNSCDIKSSSISVLSPSFPQEYRDKSRQLQSHTHILLEEMVPFLFPYPMHSSPPPLSLCVFLIVHDLWEGWEGERIVERKWFLSFHSHAHTGKSLKVKGKESPSLLIVEWEGFHPFREKSWDGRGERLKLSPNSTSLNLPTFSFLPHYHKKSVTLLSSLDYDLPSYFFEKDEHVWLEEFLISPPFFSLSLSPSFTILILSRCSNACCSWQSRQKVEETFLIHNNDSEEKGE